MSTARFVLSRGSRCRLAGLSRRDALLHTRRRVTSLWRAALRRIPLSLGRSPLRKCGHDAARAVVGDREYDVVADPKFSPHPLALDELGVVVLGEHDDVGPEAPDLK